MCDFTVIIRFGFHSLCDNGIRSRSMSFHFGWRILPCCPLGEEVPWLCVGEVAVNGLKDHMQKRSYLMCSLYCPWGERKTLRVWVRLAKSLHTGEDNIMPIVNGWIPWPIYVVVWYICNNLPYVRYYGFGNYIVSRYLV